MTEEIGLDALMSALDEKLNYNSSGFNKPVTATEFLDNLSKAGLSKANPVLFNQILSLVSKYLTLRRYIPKYHKDDLKLGNYYSKEYADRLRKEGLEV